VAGTDPTRRQWQIDWKQVGDYLLSRSTHLHVGDGLNNVAMENVI